MIMQHKSKSLHQCLYPKVEHAKWFKNFIQARKNQLLKIMKQNQEECCTSFHQQEDSERKMNDRHLYLNLKGVKKQKIKEKIKDRIKDRVKDKAQKEDVENFGKRESVKLKIIYTIPRQNQNIKNVTIQGSGFLFRPLNLSITERQKINYRQNIKKSIILSERGNALKKINTSFSQRKTYSFIQNLQKSPFKIRPSSDYSRCKPNDMGTKMFAKRRKSQILNIKEKVQKSKEEYLQPWGISHFVDDLQQIF